MQDEIGAYIFFGSVLLCAVVAFASCVRVQIIWWKLGRYLEEHNPERLLWLVGAREMGTYCHFHPFRVLRYFYSKEDDGASTVATYKLRIRQSHKVALVMAITIATLFVLLGIYVVIRTMWFI